MRDLYKVLGVSPTATPDEIKSAYRRLARLCHPDVAGNDKVQVNRFREIAAAYAILREPGRRARYDRERMVVRGRGGISSSLFGPLFDELVDKVDEEGISVHNVDSLFNNFVTMAEEAKKNLPSRIARQTSTPGGLLEFIERMTGTTIEKPGRKK